MYPQHTVYFIATSMLAGIGPILAKQLISYIGSAEQIFKEPISHIKKIPNIGPVLAHEIKTNNVLPLAEKELLFAEKNKINILTYIDDAYPNRLKNCEDSPLLFYYKGDVNFNHSKIISIVGTRSATDYGRSCTKELIQSISHNNPIIVSGLALGIDVTAHKEALTHNLQTIAVLGPQLTNITPVSHVKIAKEIVKNGAVMTESHSQTLYDNALYVKRNRIIAGLSDATIIVESKTRGGALITTEFANQYNRDVCAFPGNIGNKYSQGCNMLIKQNKATLIESGEDLEKLLNWDVNSNQKKHIQTALFRELHEDEKKIVDVLSNKTELSIDSIASIVNFPMSKTSSLLLQLEFDGIVKMLPGKRYCKL